MKVLMMFGWRVSDHYDGFVDKKKEQVYSDIMRIWSDADISFVSPEDLDRGVKLDTLQAINQMTIDKIVYDNYSIQYLNGILGGIVDDNLMGNNLTNYDELSRVVEAMNNL